MAKRVQFGGQVIEMPDDATDTEMAQAVFESRATPEGLGVAPTSGVDAREAFRARAAAGMQEVGSGTHPTEGYNPMMEALQPFYGAAKGAANTILGAREMLQRRVPGLRRAMEADPFNLSPEAVERTRESVAPQGTAQNIGYSGEQVGEFVAPGALAGKAGKLANVAERVKQGRTAAGAFTKAIRTPVMRDVIKRMLVREGTEAAATGVLNEAQGGEFATGAVASIGGQAVGGVANKAAPLIKKLLKHRTTATAGGILLGGGALGIGGDEGYGHGRHLTAGRLAKAGLVGGTALGMASPFARGPIIGAFLQLFDRANPGEYVSGKGAKIDSAANASEGLPRKPRGPLQAGNIDLYNRPHVQNPNGSVSTVRSISVNVDGREVLIPTVSDDGRIMSNKEALDTYKRTGRHLGMFDSPASANAYAEQLHNQYAAGVYDKRR